MEQVEPQRAFNDPPTYDSTQAYTHNDPATLILPSPPSHSLPSLRSLQLPDHAPPATFHLRASLDLSPKSQVSQWAPLSAMVPHASESELGSPMDTTSFSGNAEQRRETSILSVDDPDVRLAAEALRGLGNLDFARSLSARSPTTSIREASAQPEPLLNLLTSAHPWLGGSIHGSISAYNTTKDYSPRFVKYGAELIERNIGSPVVNTVSSVGRRTGVEQNLRRYLGETHRRPDDLEAGDHAVTRKRPRTRSPAEGDEMDIEAVTESRMRVDSQSSYAESLPAYDDYRSPTYSERPEEPASKNMTQQQQVNWSTQLIMTTSGLGVALSESSLKSLRICVRLLRGATHHIDRVTQALKRLLEEYETALRNHRQPNDQAIHDPSQTTDTSMDTKEDEIRHLAERIKSLSSDIWTTLQNVVQSVSRYAGGRLPQNASQVVRTQLLSVPQRWQLARRSAGAEQQGEEVRGANRMLAFAKEGLDMMGQITTVVDGTVQSAESWLARIGRQPAQDGGELDAEKAPFTSVRVDKMEKS